MVLLISWAKFPLALIIGAAVMGGVAGVQPADIVTSFTRGLGSTTGSVGLLIALGGDDRQVAPGLGRVRDDRRPVDRWRESPTAALDDGADRLILGIPLFFEVGVVLLVPVVILVARKLDLSLMKVGIPALAGLSILHGFVPPHPGPLLAIDIVKADLSTVLLYGLVISCPRSSCPVRCWRASSTSGSGARLGAPRWLGCRTDPDPDPDPDPLPAPDQRVRGTSPGPSDPASSLPSCRSPFRSSSCPCARSAS